VISDQEVPAYEVKFLYVLLEKSDSWRCKQVPGDSLGLKLIFIMRRSLSA
jgi:hypothetical protein